MDDTGLDAIRAARRELDEVIAEIRAVPGHEDFLAAPTFSDISAVAGTDRPLVYFAAADAGGLALVVRGDEVSDVPLEDLTADAVRARVSDYLAAYDGLRRDPSTGCPAWRRALEDVTAWLWGDAVGPVLDELGAVSHAVFVPGGLLGLLPLHAAWTPDDAVPSRRRYALDALTVTYVPNARALAAARVLAGRPADRLLAVVDPPQSPPAAPLRYAPVEATVAGHTFANRTTVDGATATVSRVLEEIRRADVAHLACHGFADLQTPLDSGLLLADGEVLRLRDLLDLRTQLRLAVLSACETSLPGTELPDEVVSLPTGLLQAGVGGVVASLWAVPDMATALLMADFYRRWRGEGMSPPYALRGAQLWLRDTADEEKARVLEKALDADDSWLPPAAADAFLDGLLERAGGYAEIDSWAGFAYVGA